MATVHAIASGSKTDKSKLSLHDATIKLRNMQSYKDKSTEKISQDIVKHVTSISNIESKLNSFHSTIAELKTKVDTLMDEKNNKHVVEKNEIKLRAKNGNRRITDKVYVNFSEQAVPVDYEFTKEEKKGSWFSKLFSKFTDYNPLSCGNDFQIILEWDEENKNVKITTAENSKNWSFKRLLDVIRCKYDVYLIYNLES